MNNATQPELKSCPFCGSEAYLSHAQCGIDGMSLLARNPRCGGCGADLGYCKNDQQATAAWNTRTPQWQTIDSAPKDGTPILGVWLDWQDGKRIGIVSWAGSWTPYDRKIICWQPLPTPPGDDA